MQSPWPWVTDDLGFFDLPKPKQSRRCLWVPIMGQCLGDFLLSSCRGHSSPVLRDFPSNGALFGLMSQKQTPTLYSLVELGLFLLPCLFLSILPALVVPPVRDLVLGVKSRKLPCFNLLGFPTGLAQSLSGMINCNLLCRHRSGQTVKKPLEELTVKVLQEAKPFKSWPQFGEFLSS